MILIHVNRQTAELAATEPLVSGSVNAYGAAFTFSEEWEGITPTAVFRAGGDEISVPLIQNACVLPWEVLAKRNTGLQLYVGVYGVGEGEVVFPTTWVRAGVIRDGAEPGDNAEPPTPDVYQQFVDAIRADAETAGDAAQTAAQDAAAATQEAARALTAAGTARDMAILAQTAQEAAEAAESAASAAADMAGQYASQAQAAAASSTANANRTETLASDAELAAQDAADDATAAEEAAVSANQSASSAGVSEENAKSSETAARQAAADAVSAWTQIRDKAVVTAERTYPTAPQIDFTVTEAAQALAFTEIGGVPLQDFGFAEMRFYCENAAQTAADASELRVALNRSSTAMYTAATEFLIQTRQLYTSGGVSLKDGTAYTAAPQTNKAWRGAVSMQIDPYLGYGRVVRSVNFWSNLSLIPAGTKIQVWLR